MVHQYVCEVIGQLQNMSTADDNVPICANCGKEGDDVNNVCNKCKMVKYCNAACKKKHRHKHKKQCEEHLRLAAEKYDVELFKQPPQTEDDCPICFLLLPTLSTGMIYMACCGKMICTGCLHAPLYDNLGNEVDNKKCPFCRVPTPTSNDEGIERLQKRMEKDDPIAMFNHGNYYKDRSYGFPQDMDKALELWQRAAELGFPKAYGSIGYLYDRGQGVEIDKKKASHYWELAAIGGCVQARHNLGVEEKKAGNWERALKHYIIAVRGGDANSLEQIKELYTNGQHAAKDDYMLALRSYQEYLSEIKSDQRDEAATAREDNRYH